MNAKTNHLEIEIGKDKIGDHCPPYIIAELSANHNGSLDRALEIVEKAAETGVNAIKIQTYTADTMTLDLKENEFLIKDPKSLWYGKSLYELYDQAHTPWEWHKPIFDLCKDLGLTFFSTPFDATAVNFLEEMNVPAYKIASFENTDLPLVQKVAATGKPIFISTGMANLAELYETVQKAWDYGCKDLVLLKCTSTYPASPEDSNIATIPHLKNLFPVQVGLSDHTLGIGVPVAAVTLGATVIEKHFTLSRSDEGLDSAFSLEPDEMKKLVEETKQAWLSLGKIQYGSTDKEKASLQFRRSIYIVNDIKKGEKLSKDNLRCIRPGLGLPTKYFERVIGKRAVCDLKRGTPLNWHHFG